MNSCLVKNSSYSLGTRNVQNSWENANKVVGYRSTMRICGGFGGLEQLGGGEKRAQADGVTRERVGPSLLPIDHADGRSHLQAGLPESRDGLERGPAGGDDVLDQADELARLEHSLDPVRRAVLLGLRAHDQER